MFQGRGEKCRWRLFLLYYLKTLLSCEEDLVWPGHKSFNSCEIRKYEGQSYSSNSPSRKSLNWKDWYISDYASPACDTASFLMQDYATARLISYLHTRRDWNLRLTIQLLQQHSRFLSHREARKFIPHHLRSKHMETLASRNFPQSSARFLTPVPLDAEVGHPELVRYTS